MMFVANCMSNWVGISLVFQFVSKGLIFLEAVIGSKRDKECWYSLFLSFFSNISDITEFAKFSNWSVCCIAPSWAFFGMNVIPVPFTGVSVDLERD